MQSICGAYYSRSRGQKYCETCVLRKSRRAFFSLLSRRYALLFSKDNARRCSDIVGTRGAWKKSPKDAKKPPVV